MCCEAKACGSGGEKVRVEVGELMQEEAVCQLVGFCRGGRVAREESERQRAV